MTNPIISIENLSKAYRIGARDETPDTLIGALKGIAIRPWKNWRELRSLDTSHEVGAPEETVPAKSEGTLWALRNVSFDVNEGDVVGVIGRNGAGKSTLLKVLSRITEPTSGRAIIRGRVSSLLEVGTGFHPELTGRDNVYMNGTILGMTKREIDRKFEEIVDFSGVGKFLDTPTKRYSSGMQVRLAFAVAAHLEPEILIVDEVLAVGDFAFQKKCIGKMRTISETGRTVLFVSHNHGAMSTFCNSGVLMRDGTAKSYRCIKDCIQDYLNDGNATHGVGPTPSTRSDLGITVTTSDSAIKRHMGSELVLQLTVSSETPLCEPTLGFVVFDEKQVTSRWWKLEARAGDITRDFQRLVDDRNLGDPPLMPGNYSISLWIGSSGRDLASFADFYSLKVDAGDPFECGVPLPKSWGHFYWKTKWSFDVRQSSA